MRRLTCSGQLVVLLYFRLLYFALGTYIHALILHFPRCASPLTPSTVPTTIATSPAPITTAAIPYVRSRSARLACAYRCSSTHMEAGNRKPIDV